MTVSRNGLLKLLITRVSSFDEIVNAGSYRFDEKRTSSKLFERNNGLLTLYKTKNIDK